MSSTNPEFWIYQFFNVVIHFKISFEIKLEKKVNRNVHSTKKPTRSPCKVGRKNVFSESRIGCWKSLDFLRSKRNLKKISSWFGRLLSKCTKHEEDCTNFCVLLRKSELYVIGPQHDSFSEIYIPWSFNLKNSGLFKFLLPDSTWSEFWVKADSLA